MPEFGELAVALGGHGLGFLQEKLELGAVVAHSLEPFREFEVAEMDPPTTADGEVLAVEVRVFEGVGRERVEVEVGVGVEVLLEVRDASFEGVDFRDGALEREAERIHGAFEAFEKFRGV